MPIFSSPSGWGSTKKAVGPWWGQYDPDAEPVQSAYTTPGSPKYSKATADRAAAGGVGGGGGASWQQGQGGGASSGGLGASWSFGGKSPFATDAAAAKLRDEFARLKKSGKGAMNEDLASRGIFSSGVGGRLQSEQDTQYGLAEGAALEDLYNRSAQLEMGFALEQQRMAAEDARARASAGAQRYGNANEIQDLLGLMGQQDGGSQRFGGSGGMGGGIQAPAGGAGGAGALNDPKTGEPIKGTPDYFNRWQAWFRNKGIKATGSSAAGGLSGMASGAMDSIKGLF